MRAALGEAGLAQLHALVKTDPTASEARDAARCLK